MGQKTGDIEQVEIVEEIEEMEDGTETTDVEVTRARIEQTRAEMSGTIDAIKAKLEPQTLMQQAKETVSEVTANAAEKAKETVAEVTQRAKETVHDVTADVVQQAKDALPTVTANAVSGAVTEAKEAVGSAVHTAKEAVGDAVGTATEAMSGAVDHAKDAGSALAEVIRRHPVPAALIGVGLGWLWMRSRQHGSTQDWQDRSYATRYPESGSGQAWRGSTEDTYRYRRDYGTESAAGATTDGTVRRVQGKVSEVAGNVQEKVSEVAGNVQEKAGHLAGQVQEKAGQLAHQVGDLGGQAMQQMRQTGDWFQRTLHENPLAIGAVALGLGAAIGLLLPETQAENRWMGETRDRLADKAQQAAQDLKLKAQIVAEEAMETVTEEARNQGLAPPAASKDTASAGTGGKAG